MKRNIDNCPNGQPFRSTDFSFAMSLQIRLMYLSYQLACGSIIHDYFDIFQFIPRRHSVPWPNNSKSVRVTMSVRVTIPLNLNTLSPMISTF